MERIKESEIREIKKDHVASREFIREISLKLRTRRSKDEEDLTSLYEMIIDK